MRIVIVSSLLSLILLWSGVAFAQDAVSNDDSVPVATANAAESTSIQVADSDYDWQKESKLYKGLGWVFFGGGLALGIAGPIIAVAGGLNSLGDNGYDIAGFAVTTLGGAMLTTGIALLIAEAVKFGPYRRGEVSSAFTWQPEFYASPELSGFGISARF